MYQFIDSVDPREHDAFVKAHPLCDLLQSSAWTKVKSNWDHQIVGLRKRSRLATSALILIRRLPLGLCMMYIPRGPIMDLTDEEMTRSFFQALKAWAKKQRCIFIKMDPAVLLRSYPYGTPQPEEDPAALRCIENMKQAGAIRHGFPLMISDSVQPRFSMGVEACDDLDAQLPQSTIRSRNVAIRKQVKVAEASIEELPLFAEVMHSTENRKHIHLRDEEYFNRLMRAYKEHAHLFLARIDVPAYHAGLCQEEEQIRLQLQDPELGRKAARKLNQRLTQLTQEKASIAPLLEKISAGMRGGRRTDGRLRQDDGNAVCRHERRLLHLPSAASDLLHTVRLCVCPRISVCVDGRGRRHAEGWPLCLQSKLQSDREGAHRRI